MTKAFRVLRKLRNFKLLKPVAGPLRTNTYLILLTKTAEAILVDSPPGVWEALQPIISGVSLKLILLTQGHFDHAAEASLVRGKNGASVVMHPADKHLFRLSKLVAKNYGVNWVDPKITKCVVSDGFLNLTNDLRVKALHPLGIPQGL